MIKHFTLLITLGLIACFAREVHAQDPQFSQFYAAPLYLNPALTGNTASARVGANFRHQWPALDASFTTFSAYLDYFLEDYNSGVGVLFMRDQQGLAGLNSTSSHIQYSYQLPLTGKITFRPGISIGAIQRSVNMQNLQFADQFNGTGFNPISSTSEDLSGLKPIWQFDIGLGGVFYTPSAYLGVSAVHLNEPSYTFFDSKDENAYLPNKISIHGGYRFFLPANTLRPGFDKYGRERSITPSAEFKMQGEFKQLSVGAYLTYEPLIIGLWYRGLPVSGLENVSNNNESAIALVGLTFNSLNIGYSFDYTLSDLGIDTGGAHELSISHNFRLGNPRKPPKNVRQIPCPNF